jgi:hypothetical protein
MANTPDYTKMFQDMFANLPVDMTSMNDVVKNSIAAGGKFSSLALAAAEKNAEISANWTKDTLAKMADASKSQAEPADYSKSLTEFATAQAETASEHVAAFTEVAKKVQMDTVEMIMAAGKEVQAEATAAVKKATDEATVAVKKATTDASAAVKKATDEASAAVKKASKAA